MSAEIAEIAEIAELKAHLTRWIPAGMLLVPWDQTLHQQQWKPGQGPDPNPVVLL
jgi:hypothetical protein